MDTSLVAFVLPLALLFGGCSGAPTPTADISPPTKETRLSERYPLLVSHDFGASWVPAGNELPPDIEVSFLETLGAELVVATDNKGVFISRDNKTRWKAIGDGLPNAKINALHIAGDTIWVGVYQHGIYWTIDQGVAWQSYNADLSNLSVQAICSYDQAIWVGTDGGIFKRAANSPGWEPTTVRAQVLSLYPYEQKLVAGTSRGTLLSKDNGETWNWIRQEGAVHYTHPLGKRIVELVLNGDVVYSDDWGANWQATSYQPRAGSYVYEIVEVGDYQVLCNNYGVHRSADGGVTWEHIYPTEAMAFFDLQVEGDVIYGGTRTWDEYRKRQ